MTETTFDAYAGVYADTVNASVGFGGKTVEFFARLKVRALLRTAARLGCPLEEVRALDVGSGTGIADSMLIPAVATLDGVDVSMEMVAQAAGRNPSATYQVYDGVRLPFEDRSFHLVFASCVLHHVPPHQWDSFIAELWRVTGSPGAAVVIEHNPFNPLTRKAVRACPFDEDAVLARPRRVGQGFRRAGVERPERKFVTFFPFDQPALARLEDALWWLPAGAQYMVTAFAPHYPWRWLGPSVRSDPPIRATRSALCTIFSAPHLAPWRSDDHDVAHG
jgi:ubiquinone/menaquinone biosynthesis C-methylase UbiE